MSHYNHLSSMERENLLIFKVKGLNIRQIAKELRRSPSTISRELRRNSLLGTYSAFIALELSSQATKSKV